MSTTPQQKTPKNNWGWIAMVLGIGGFMVVVLAFALINGPSRSTLAELCKPARDFEAKWIQGKEFAPAVAAERGHYTLKDFAGKPTVINFWASWCVSCRAEAVDLEKFWRKHGQEINILGVAVQDEEESAMAFARQFGKTYILGLDEKGRAGIDYGVVGVPETFFLDAKGRVIHKVSGPVTTAELEQQLGHMIAGDICKDQA